MKQTAELKKRIEAKRKELEARIAEGQANANQSMQARAKQAESELEELKSHLKQGWENLTEDVAGRLNRWLQKH